MEQPGALAQGRLAAGFLAPAVFFLLVGWSTRRFARSIRSFFGQRPATFVGFDNYQELFTTRRSRAIKNNAIWVAVVPAFVTAIGLIFAVLTERVRWSVAFKTVSSCRWRSPPSPRASSGGSCTSRTRTSARSNAPIGGVKDVFTPPGVLADARPRPTTSGLAQAGLVLTSR